MKFLLAFLSAVLVAQASESYANCMNLAAKKGQGHYTLEWTLTGTTLKAKVSGPSAGWVGIGFPKSLGYDEMDKAEFFMGAGDTVYNYFNSMDENTKPNEDRKGKGYKFAETLTGDGMSSIAIERLLKPTDGMPQIFPNANNQYVLWAAGPVDAAGYDGLQFHTVFGHQKVNLSAKSICQAGTAPEPEDDHEHGEHGSTKVADKTTSVLPSVGHGAMHAAAPIGAFGLHHGVPAFGVPAYGVPAHVGLPSLSGRVGSRGLPLPSSLPSLSGHVGSRGLPLPGSARSFARFGAPLNTVPAAYGGVPVGRVFGGFQGGLGARVGRTIIG